MHREIGLAIAVHIERTITRAITGSL
jgi:hypothetical protein